jgi:predicted RNA-binding protein with PIN domain
MAIHLIIDGYNLLGVRGGLRGDVESRREALIRELAGYRHRKGYPLTVVFDGWRSGQPVERAEWREGIEVVFSRQGETADSVIKRLAEKFGADSAVVSSDHEVVNFARARDCTVITSGEFETRLQSSGARPAARKQAADEEEEVQARRDPKKKGNPKKLPKALRQKARQLKRF